MNIVSVKIVQLRRRQQTDKVFSLIQGSMFSIFVSTGPKIIDREMFWIAKEFLSLLLGFIFKSIFFQISWENNVYEKCRIFSRNWNNKDSYSYCQIRIFLWFLIIYIYILIDCFYGLSTFFRDFNVRKYF